MPSITIEVEGIKALEAKLNKLRDVGAAVGPAFLTSGYEVRDWVKQYPPSGIANAPKAPGRWYERGYGSKYARRDGTVTGRKTSEMLNRSWSMTHTTTAHGVEVRIGNRASYARYVHDEERQAGFHAARGWRTAQAAIRKFESVIVKRISDAIDRAMR
jgi:hypothetical protein